MSTITAPTEYSAFIARKSQIGGMSGFDPIWMPDFLFDFQKFLVDWDLRKGRAATLADCGLGKTPIQLVWAENVVRKVNKPVIIVMPLTVTGQTVREGQKFGIECHVSRDGRAMPNITVTNYEKLHLFNPHDFAGAACDESSIIKNFMGTRRKIVTEFMREMPYRLLCTATAAPNDFIELGTSSEALGELGHMDMLARFFKNDDKTLHLMGQKYGDLTQKGWKFKAHAEESFWRWVCSWARACRKPSDLGFDDSRFILPGLVTNEHAVQAATIPDGFLFETGATTMDEQREEQRRTIPERCERVAELVAPHDVSVCWCHLNGEADLLEKLIPGSRQVSGSTPDEDREELIEWFSDPRAGKRTLISKPRVMGFGLNFQFCAHHTFFPSHSFEQYYQCIRRSLRFGQTRTVEVDMVTTDGARGILENMKRKTEAADRMFTKLIDYMNHFQRIGRTAYGELQPEIPLWL